MLREITLKTFEGYEGRPAVTSAELIRLAVENPGQGVVVSQIAKALVVGDLLRAVENAKSVKVDNETWQFIKDKFATMPWGMVHNGIKHVFDDISNAETVDPNAMKPAETQKAK